MSILSIKEILTTPSYALKGTTPQTIRLRRPIYRKLKIFCFENDMVMNKYFTSIIEKDLIERGIISQKDVDSVITS